MLGMSHAMLWEHGEGHRLDRFDTGFSNAAGVNDADEVVITVVAAHADNDCESYVYRGGRLAYLGAFEATAMNASGQVIGYHAGSMADCFGIIWDGAGQRTLGDVDDSVLPVDINDRGQVVSSIGSAAQHAVVWQDGVLLDLNQAIPGDSGWELCRARSINNVGQIVGYGALNGQQQAFLLTASDLSP
jgi:uncharacterized membrane protein